MNREKLVFFLGAGASIFPPSYLPAAQPLKEMIFLTLCKHLSYKPDPDVLRMFNEFPVEFLLQIIKDVYGEKIMFQALRPLSSNSPNLIHYGIAHLAKMGICDVAITVNFDTLLERALRKERIGFEVFAEENVPLLLSSPRQNKFRLYKLHGTLEKPSTIIATLDKVGSPLSKTREKLLYQLLHTQKIIFIGYRGADTDIKPIIMSHLKQNPQKIIWNALDRSGVDNDVLPLISPKMLVFEDGMSFFQNLLKSFCELKKPILPSNENKAWNSVNRILRHLGYSKIAQRKENKSHSYRNPKERINHYHLMFTTEIRLGHWTKAQRWLNLGRKEVTKMTGKEQLYQNVR